MRTIVIASRKGGAGKTTICTLLAVEAERAGAGAVAMVDLDPMRGLTQWWEARKADAPTLVASDGGAVAAFAAAKVSGAALVLVDTPPATAPGTRALSSADRASGYEPGGRGFESPRAHHSKTRRPESDTLPGLRASRPESEP